MGIELKTVNPVVFDDTDHCNDKSILNGYCSFMRDLMMGSFCDLFNGQILKRDDKTWVHEKCQECKEHYQKAKG